MGRFLQHLILYPLGYHPTEIVSQQSPGLVFIATLFLSLPKHLKWDCTECKKCQKNSFLNIFKILFLVFKKYFWKSSFKFLQWKNVYLKPLYMNKGKWKIRRELIFQFYIKTEYPRNIFYNKSRHLDHKEMYQMPKKKYSFKIACFRMQSS